MIRDSFWRGRRVFVTGHTGCKGSWLTLWPPAMGARVTGFAPPSPTRLNLLEERQGAAEIRPMAPSFVRVPARRRRGAAAETRRHRELA